MIAKLINRSSGGDFGRLARYLATASEPGETLDRMWLAGCVPGHDDDGVTLFRVDSDTAMLEWVETLRDTEPTGDDSDELLLDGANMLAMHRGGDKVFLGVTGINNHGFTLFDVNLDDPAATNPAEILKRPNQTDQGADETAPFFMTRQQATITPAVHHNICQYGSIAFHHYKK